MYVAVILYGMTPKARITKWFWKTASKAEAYGKRLVERYERIYNQQ